MLSPAEMARLLGQELPGYEGMMTGAGGTPTPLYLGGGWGGLGGPSIGPAPLRDQLGLRSGSSMRMPPPGAPPGAMAQAAPIDPLTMAILGLLATQGPVGGPGPEAQAPTPSVNDPGSYGQTADRGPPRGTASKAGAAVGSKVGAPRARDGEAPRFDLSPSTPADSRFAPGSKVATGFYSPAAPPDVMQASLPMAGMRPAPAPGGNAGSATVPKPTAPRSPAGPAVAGARGAAPQVEPPPGSLPVAPNAARSAAPPIDANAWRQLQDAWLFDPMARPALGAIQAGGAGVGVG